MQDLAKIAKKKYIVKLRDRSEIIVTEDQAKKLLKIMDVKPNAMVQIAGRFIKVKLIDTIDPYKETMINIFRSQDAEEEEKVDVSDLKRIYVKGFGDVIAQRWNWAVKEGLVVRFIDGDSGFFGEEVESGKLKLRYRPGRLWRYLLGDIAKVS